MKLSFRIFSLETIKRDPALRKKLKTLLREAGLTQLANEEILWYLRRSFVIALNEHGKPVGFISFMRPKAGEKEIYTFVTMRTIAHEGIATRMTNALGQWARKRGFKVIRRDFQSENMLDVARRHAKRAKSEKGPFSTVSIRRRNVKMHLMRKPPIRRK